MNSSRSRLVLCATFLCVLAFQGCGRYGTKSFSVLSSTPPSSTTAESGGTSVMPTPTPAPSGVGSNRGLMWGVNGHPYGGAIGGGPYANLPQQMQLLASLGVKHYRVDFYGADSTSLSVMQNLLNVAQLYGIVVTPALIMATQDNETDSYNAAYTFVKAFVANFPSIPVYELGNETNNQVLSPYNDNSAASNFENAAAFPPVRGMLRGMLDGMRAANPKALGALGISGGCNVGFLQALYNDGLRWDITVDHPYDFWGDPENLDITYDHSQSNGTCAQPNNMAALAAFGKPIWLTEFNYTPAVGANDKTAMGTGLKTMISRFASMAQKYDIEAADIYELFDEPAASGNEAHFGIFTSTGAVTDASTAVQTYILTNPSVVYP